MVDGIYFNIVYLHFGASCYRYVICSVILKRLSVLPIMAVLRNPMAVVLPSLCINGASVTLQQGNHTCFLMKSNP